MRKEGLFWARRFRSFLLLVFSPNFLEKNTVGVLTGTRRDFQDFFIVWKESLKKNATIKSDEHKNYPEFVHKFFPHGHYQRFKGAKGSIVGQGELKKLKRDPLFMINHTCAMLRANINRLIRKTWCTTKDPGMLQKHLDIYIDFHNTILVKPS